MMQSGAKRNTQHTAPAVRASMLKFPGWTQRGWTWLVGQPYPGQPRSGATPWSYLASTLACLVLSIAINACCVVSLMSATPVMAAGLAIVMFYALLVTTGSARVLHVVIAHHCTHRAFSCNLKIDRAVAEAIGLLIFMAPFDRFAHDHVGIHHSKKLATVEDPDVQMLLALGFLPGKTRRQLWLTLFRNIVSVRFHWMFLLARICWNLLDKTTPVRRRLAALAVHGGILCGVIAACCAGSSLLPLLVYLVAFALPVGPGFAISALIQWCSEHKWLRVETEDPYVPYRVLLARLTNGRFIGDAVPATRRELGMVQWTMSWFAWIARLLLVHIPVRVYLWVGDLSCHDYHHRHARDLNWINAIHSRAEAVANPKAGEELWTEVWNLAEAINSVFDLLAALPPLPTPTLSRQDREEILQGM